MADYTVIRNFMTVVGDKWVSYKVGEVIDEKTAKKIGLGAKAELAKPIKSTSTDKE